jgi:hypothetical protein
VDEADHQLRVPKRAQRTAEQVNNEILAALEGWIRKTLSSAAG